MISNNLSLWQIGSEYQQLLSELYDSETGEINELVQAKLDKLAPSVEKKCIAVAAYLRKIESEEIELDRLLHEVEERKKAYNREVSKWVDYLKNNMERCNIKEIKCPYFTLKIKQNPYSTEIIDERLIPEKYLVKKEIVKVEVKPDKTAIKEYVLQSGEEVPGAKVAQKTRLDISVSKL